MITPLGRVASAFLLVAPAAALVFLGVRAGSMLVSGGAIVALLGSAALLRHPAVWRPPVSGALILLYLSALGWAWINTYGTHDTPAQLVRGLLLLVPVGLLVAHDLHKTGAEPRRRATRLCRKIQSRTRWPDRFADVETLPEVRQLREALWEDPGPVYKLLMDPRPEVRASGYAALFGRTEWSPRESYAVASLAQRVTEPGVRAMAVYALAHVKDAPSLEIISGFLRDPSPEVRMAASMVCVDTAGLKWAFVRDAVRATLSEPRLAKDGALPGTAGLLSPIAICDLMTWSNDGEPLGTRAIRTLIDHYAVCLQSSNYYDLVPVLSQQLTDPNTPSVLRVELAILMKNFGLLTPELLDRMSNADQPGPVRLLAAEVLLQNDPNDADGIDVLRGLGRQSNREMALAIARILQQYLNLDMGLQHDHLEVKSKQAGEVTRRVLNWAVGKLPDVRAEVGIPSPASLPGLPPAVVPPTHPGQPGLKKVW